jgi:NAD(P)-dependent dehydrogenase (short-subunit alcohol dehydrogenase family)
MSYDLAGRKVLLTGGSAGIGAALAEGFAERGAVVGICGRRADRLAEVLARLQAHSPESRSWQVDLADLDGVEAFAARADEELGGIDVLVNNAGIPKRRWTWDLTPAVVEQVMAINYLSPVRLTLALLPALIERSGRVVTISSVAARLSPPAESAYSASKAAITAFFEGLKVDLSVAGVDVGVHLVNPGVIDTELFSLPDNDETLADVEALPVTAMVEPVVAMLDEGTFEIYVPDWFTGVVPAKFPDTGAFLKGSADYARQRLVDLGRPVPLPQGATPGPTGRGGR